MSLSYLKSALVIVLVLTFCYAVLCLLLYLFQDKLIFIPQKISQGDDRAIQKSFSATELQIKTMDGVTLRGWWVKPEGWERKPILLYFGGNAEEVSGNLWDNPLLHEASWVLLNYRGYGRSEGIPSSRTMRADALEVYDYLRQQPGVDPKRVFVLGRSLGAALALEVSLQRPVAGLILVTPWDSLKEVAKTHYAFFPVSWILKDHWDLVALLKDFKVPTLVLVAGRDSVIPATHAQRLAEALAGPKQIHVIPLAEHNNIQAYPEYWEAIRKFLESN